MDIPFLILMTLLGINGGLYVIAKEKEITTLKDRISILHDYLEHLDHIHAAEQASLVELGIERDVEQSIFWNKHTGQKAAIRS